MVIVNKINKIITFVHSGYFYCAFSSPLLYSEAVIKKMLSNVKKQSMLRPTLAY